jgi:Asp-tRNA(Asn)/Glu-tRNA(Gln) amidotransferase A subunit family amidase
MRDVFISCRLISLLGEQVVGRLFREDDVLALARALAEEAPWVRREAWR